jgi:monoamine oxidase/SAM-dependent methyltransferase
VVKLAIVGGGPGGLMMAHLLERFPAGLFDVTLFEATPRLGGKVLTKRFDTIPALYEAGVAELYDYSDIGLDPLKTLVQDLGLKAVPMHGHAVVLGDEILRSEHDFRRRFGVPAFRALSEFHKTCAALYSSSDYYEGHVAVDRQHPWAHRTFREVLDKIPDENARRYVEAAVRSDTATEPHLTSALNGLKNVLMDDPRYMRLYSIDGGIEKVVEGMVGGIKQTEIVSESRLVAIGRAPDGRYRLRLRNHDHTVACDFDRVVLALPHNSLSQIQFEVLPLRLAVQKHLARYDHPAHYLRVTVVFERAFWRGKIGGSYFLSDAFGGCCVYDEGLRHACEPYGVLGWLLAGNAAATLCNLGDRELIACALDSLPQPLTEGRGLFKEGRVHRWINAISGLPGGWDVQELRDRHVPAPESDPGLHLVGDYLFDCTINGVFDSAEYVSEAILSEWRQRVYTEVAEETTPALAPPTAEAGPLGSDYFDYYDGERPYEESFEEHFDETYTIDLIRTIFHRSPPYRLLDCGSANGLTLQRFARKKVDAWGIEYSPYIYARTPEAWRARNILGDVRKLPFDDGFFDFVYETCLCYLPEADLDTAISELFRVCRVGVFFGSITTDMTKEVIEAYELFEGIQTFSTLWEWSERFVRNGFRVATADLKVLQRAWKIEVEANQGDFAWYPDMESMRYCFYVKPDAPAPRANHRAVSPG